MNIHLLVMVSFVTLVSIASAPNPIQQPSVRRKVDSTQDFNELSGLAYLIAKYENPDHQRNKDLKTSSVESGQSRSSVPEN